MHQTASKTTTTRREEERLFFLFGRIRYISVIDNFTYIRILYMSYMYMYFIVNCTSSNRPGMSNNE